MLTDLQKKTSQAIVNIFESGGPLGDYSAVALIKGDKGGLSYGRAQATLMSGSLFILISRYCEAPGAQFADALSHYLDKMQQMDASLNNDDALKTLLGEAGRDAVMQSAQDNFFDQGYWNPALAAATRMGAESALGVTITYDSWIQSGGGGWQRLASQTNDQFDTIGNIDEERWYGHYVALRREWLAASASAPVRKSVYRMDAFIDLIGQDKWDLPLPLTVRGVTIDEKVLAGTAPARRLVKLTSPFMTGDDVRRVQQALVNAGYAANVDGIYGPGTTQMVKQFQQARGLVPDGIVGPTTLAALGLA
jgi:chitosanase